MKEREFWKVCKKLNNEERVDVLRRVMAALDQDGLSVGEIADLYLNGKCVGTRICKPYKFDLRDAIQEGENTLEVIVQSNLGHKRPEWLSSFMQIPPSGILGDIYLCKYES